MVIIVGDLQMLDYPGSFSLSVSFQVPHLLYRISIVPVELGSNNSLLIRIAKDCSFSDVLGLEFVGSCLKADEKVDVDVLRESILVLTDSCDF